MNGEATDKQSNIQPATETLPASAQAWLSQAIPGFIGPGVVTKFGFGQSNPTYRLDSPSGSYVLRRKPFGPLLPKAHAIDREYRVLQTLIGSDVPAPVPLAYCDDPAVLGSSFYVMELVEGRIFYDQTLPGMSRAERAAIFDGMNVAVAALHRVDPLAVGLEGFGRADGFVARQVETWTRQYRASEGERIPAMEALIDWLPANLPAAQPARIFHGDLRLDNMIFHPTEPRVVALLDWELSTLGDPIADFAYHMMVWRIPADLFRGLADIDFSTSNIPDEASYIERYCARVGLSGLPSWNLLLPGSAIFVTHGDARANVGTKRSAGKGLGIDFVEPTIVDRKSRGEFGGRLSGDKIDRTPGGILPEQRPLRPFEDFHARKIKRCAARHR